jgi:hypothetical protein
MGKCPERPSPFPPAVVGTFPYNLTEVSFTMCLCCWPPCLTDQAFPVCMGIAGIEGSSDEASYDGEDDSRERMHDPHQLHYVNLNYRLALQSSLVE